MELEEPDQYELDSENLQKQYAHYFEMCTPLTQIFQLSGEYIIWADNLTQKEIKEIQQYILDKHKTHVTTTSKPKEKEGS